MATLAPTRIRVSRQHRSLILPAALVGVALLAIGATLMYLFNASTAPDRASAIETTFQTASVTRGTITSTVTASGPITAPAELPLTFKKGGQLASVSVKVGQRVEAGQELARLDSSDLQAAVDQAQAALNEATAAQTKLSNSPATAAAAPASASASDVRAARQAVTVAEKELETARLSAAQVVHQAQANLDAMQVKLDGAQRTTASKVIEAQTVADADQVSIEAAYQSFAKAQDLYEKAVASSLVAYQNAIRELEDARVDAEMTRQQVEQDRNSDQVAVQNAEVDVRAAKSELVEARRKADADLNAAQSQVNQADAEVRTADAQQRWDCRSSSTSSCSVARRQEDAAQTRVSNSRRQVEVMRAAGRQAIVSAQSDVSRAENVLSTALATMRSNEVKAGGTLATAQSRVNTAQNGVESARAAFEKDGVSERASLIQAKSSAEQAQATQNTNLAKNQGEIVGAQNDEAGALAALNAAQVSLADAQATTASSVQHAQDQVEQANAALDVTTSDIPPATTPTPTQVEPADLDAAQARVDGAKASLQLAQNDLKAATLVAPSAGIVSRISAAAGQHVGGAESNDDADGEAEGFIALADNATSSVTARISEVDAARVRPGQKMTFTLGTFPGRTFTGTVATIDPPGSTGDGTYTVVSSVDPTDVTLTPATMAAISIIIQQATNVPLVPNAALAFAAERTSGSGQAVAPTPGQSAMAIVLRDGQPTPRQIRLGASDENNSQVLTGLDPGEQVIVSQVVNGQAAGRPGSK